MLENRGWRILQHAHICLSIAGGRKENDSAFMDSGSSPSQMKAARNVCPTDPESALPARRRLCQAQAKST